MGGPYTDPAAIAANEYMRPALRNIDEAFGEGYAKNHPELIGAYMQTVALEEQSRYLEQLGILIRELWSEKTEMNEIVLSPPQPQEAGRHWRGTEVGNMWRW